MTGRRHFFSNQIEQWFEVPQCVVRTSPCSPVRSPPPRSGTYLPLSSFSADEHGECLPVSTGSVRGISTPPSLNGSMVGQSGMRTRAARLWRRGSSCCSFSLVCVRSAVCCYGWLASTCLQEQPTPQLVIVPWRWERSAVLYGALFHGSRWSSAAVQLKNMCQAVLCFGQATTSVAPGQRHCASFCRVQYSPHYSTYFQCMQLATRQCAMQQNFCSFFVLLFQNSYGCAHKEKLL